MSASFYTYPQQMLSCKTVFTSNVAGTYASPSPDNGIDATFTFTSTGAITNDGYTLKLYDSVLLQSQTNSAHNGVYTVAVVGAAGISTVLKRRPDLSAGGQQNEGAYLTVSDGASYAGAVFTLKGPTPQVIGVDPIVFSSTNLFVGAIFRFDVAVTAAALASGAHVQLFAGNGTKQYKINQLWTNRGGTNFSGGGGDRLLTITDGTTAYSVVPATNLQTLVNAGWGISTPLPYPASAAVNTSTAAGADLYAVYSGGAADYSAGSVVISGVLQRVA